MQNVLEIVTSRAMTYEQKVVALAHAAEDSLDVLDIPERTKFFMEEGAINDLFEGHAPYRPVSYTHLSLEAAMTASGKPASSSILRAFLDR